MSLTPREEQIASLIAGGASRRDLAGRLNLSYSTVDKYLRQLKDKLHAADFPALVIRAIAWRDAAGAARPMDPAGLRLHPETPGEPETRPRGFFGAASFDELFGMLLEALAPFDVTHVVHSHVRRRRDGVIEHMASRWSLPDDVSFDMSIAAEENLSFKLAYSGETMMPLDLEALQRSEIYSFVPAHIRAQNERFLKVGLARGITFLLPGPGPADRLVTSALFQNLPAERFASRVEQAPRMLEIALRFRNAHLALARPTAALPEKTELLLVLLSGGMEPEAAAARLGMSRRAADRHLAIGREVLGARSNLSAVAQFATAEVAPPLPF